MLQITGYRLPFYPAPMLCPLCTLSPGNPRLSLQPCCFYPAEMPRPESPVQLPVNSLMALRTSSFQPYSIVAKQLNATPFSPQHVQSTPIENITRSQAARNSGVGAHNSNNDGRDERQLRCAAPEGDKKKRRKRTIFTCEQLSRLESEFEEQQYMVGTERRQLAEALNLSETQIKIWFQNRRIKWRKENKQNYPDFLASPFSFACARVRHSSEWNGNLE